MGRGTNIRMAWAVQTARKGLGKSKSKGARVPASRIHQAHVEKTMQSRMISPDRLLERLERITAADRQKSENFLLIGDWTTRVSGVVAMSARPKDALDREQGQDSRPIKSFDDHAFSLRMI